MLQLIRSKATSFVVKILFGLLIVTFGIWGIGDIFRSAGPDTTVAKVGGRAITAAELTQQVQTQIDRTMALYRQLSKGSRIASDRLAQLSSSELPSSHLPSPQLQSPQLPSPQLSPMDNSVHAARVGANRR